MILSVRCAAHMVSVNQARAFVLVNTLKSATSALLKQFSFVRQTAKGRGSVLGSRACCKNQVAACALPFWPTRLAVGLGLGSVRREAANTTSRCAPCLARLNETFGSPAPLRH